MPSPGRVFSLNIRSQTVGLAEFGVHAHGGLMLVDYRLREIPVDVAVDEAARRAQITLLLREMMDELHIRHGHVNYALAGQSVFARFVKLPAMEEEKIEKIVSFEAQQNVPFPIDEVIWGYQLVGGGGSELVQVVIVAMKVDLLEEINRAVEETGLQTSIVDVAPMTLCNAFRYNYPESGPGCSLLVDIGARTTNLLFMEPGKFFSRSVPMGGSSITAAIAREFSEPFGAAELRKKRDAFVSLGGAYAEPEDPDVGRVSKIARSTMTRLHAELMRSVSHYRAQQAGNAPTRIFLCGESAGIPYMREFFHEKFQVPIEFFNPFQNVTVSEVARRQEVTHSGYLFGELVGLALRSVTTCPMRLNLLPESVVQRQELEKRRPFFVAAAACFLLILLGWSAYYARAAGVIRQSAQALQERITPMQLTEKRFDSLKKQTASLDTVATPLITAINDHDFWPQILEDLNARLPEGEIWITELYATSGGKPLGVSGSQMAAAPTPPPPSRPGTRSGARPSVPSGPAIDGITVHGLYMYNPKQQEVVVDYFRNLISSPLFNINPNNQAAVIKSTIPTDTEWAFPYELHLDLRKPVNLP
jgi:type IV pilus assembly protein PilM